jgi:DNA-binding NarL/FixJ family response regulator
LLALDPHVCAIVSSGYANDPIVAEFERYGFRGVVVKPYRVEELCEVVQNVLARCTNGEGACVRELPDHNA